MSVVRIKIKNIEKEWIGFGWIYIGDVLETTGYRKVFISNLHKEMYYERYYEQNIFGLHKPQTFWQWLRGTNKFDYEK